MKTDDLIYLSLLFSSIGFGYFYRKIENVDAKKKIGALVGALIIVLVSGIHIIHVLVTILLNSLIILFIDKRQCHLVSFVFSFLYLFFFRTTIYFGIPYPPPHTNLIQMVLTLKLVGLAFEVNSSYMNKKKKDTATKSEEEKLEDETNYINLKFLDIVYYSLNYCGVLTGPYYRYRTFVDHLEKPYHKYDNYIEATLKKFMYVPLFAILFLWSDFNWPLEYAMTPEFSTRSFPYRYWYIWPTFFTFRMRIYIGLVLSECVCTMAGLGVYPAFAKPKAGQGPSVEYAKLKELTTPEQLGSTIYDYETIHNINPYVTDFSVTMREGVKNWNMCVQYWLAVNVYKRFPKKQYRTAVTMLVSSVWHGVYLGYYVCIGTVAFSLAVEDVLVKVMLKDNKGLSLQISKLVMFFLKMQMFSYQAIAFGLLEVGKIMKYYNSVYHCVPVLYTGLYFLGTYILKTRKDKQKKMERANEKWEKVQ